VSLGEKIKELRENRKMSQNDLASSLNVSQQAVSKWERDLGYPDIEILKNISVLFGVDVSSLLSFEKNESPLEKRKPWPLLYLLSQILFIVLDVVSLIVFPLKNLLYLIVVIPVLLLSLSSIIAPWVLKKRRVYLSIHLAEVLSAITYACYVYSSIMQMLDVNNVWIMPLFVADSAFCLLAFLISLYLDLDSRKEIPGSLDFIFSIIFMIFGLGTCFSCSVFLAFLLHQSIIGASSLFGFAVSSWLISSLLSLILPICYMCISISLYKRWSKSGTKTQRKAFLLISLLFVFLCPITLIFAFL
jgi:transcriptional regulator with XRE-family HTH domain